MELILVRHAEPAWFPDGRGVEDPELSALGHRQAAALASWWRDRVDAVWVSPAVRAVQTAAPLVDALGVAPRVLDWLVELRTPARDGLSREEMHALYDHLDGHPMSAWWDGLPGAEPSRAFVDRVAAGLDAELAALGGRRLPPAPPLAPWADLPRALRVAVVCHAGTAGAVVHHLLGLDPVPWAWKRMRLGHSAVARLRTTRVAEGLIFGLDAFNVAEHLAADDRTT